MKTIIEFKQLLLIVILLLSTNIFCQNSIVSKTSDITKVAKEILNNAETCVLITLDKEGAPRARAMDPFPVEEDFTIWFGTNSKSRKVDQIKNDSRVTLYYLDKDASGYVVISGLATLVNDQKQKSVFWKKEWESFYPENKENYLLIKVTPVWMEVLSPPHNIYNDTITWQPPVYVFKDVDN